MDTLATYFRTSLEDLDKRSGRVESSMSISNQRKLVHSFVAGHSELSAMRVVEYYDDGFTGTNFERPQFSKMMEAVKCGDISCIVVKDLSRFGRSYLEVGEYLEHIFPALGIRLLSVTDGYDSNQYFGKTGGMDVAFRNIIYDTYSKDLSLKVKSAMHTMMKNGPYISHTPYGYLKSSRDKHKMIQDLQTAPIVREIFLMAMEGLTTAEIARRLNERGVITPSRYKNHKVKSSAEEQRPRWTHVTVLNILQNIKYTGAMVNHTRESRHLRDRNQRRVPAEEWIVTEGAHEAIVSREEYDAANAKLRKPRKTEKRKSSCYDRVFYCGHCGHKLQKTFGVDTYFSCTSLMYTPGAPCKEVRWSKTALEDILLPIYKAQTNLLEQRVVEARKCQPRVDPSLYVSRIENLQKSIDKCDVEKIQQYEQYRAEQMNRDQFLAAKTQLSIKKETLQKEYDKAEDELARLQENTQETMESIEEAMHFLNQSGTEELLQRMYSSIARVNILDSEHIEIHWKYDDLFAQLPEAKMKAV